MSRAFFSSDYSRSLSARTALRSILVVYGAASVLITPLPARPESGRQVVSIRLDSDAHLNLADFDAQITQKRGEVLDRSKVAESLKKLYATGRFTDLRADVEPNGDGVELIFVARAAFFVGLVRVEGAPKSADPKLLVDASRLRPGQALAEDELPQISGRISAVLADNAYYRAQVKYGFKRHLETQEADVLIEVVAGSPARLRQVQFEGHPLVPPETLADVAGWRLGHHLTSSSLERGLVKLHRFYAAHGRLQATISVIKRVYDPRSGTEDLLLHAEAGPLVRVRVEGASISNSKLKDLLPMFRDGVVDDEALSRGEQILEDYLQRHGYFRASAKASRVEHRDPPEIEVRYRINLGAQGEFVGYSFQGNHSFLTAELASALAEKSNESPAATRNVFSQSLLSRHVDTLKAFYESQGFLEARVTPQAQEETERQLTRLSVTFRIEEGSRTTVRHLALQGVDWQAQKNLWSVLVTKPGEPYSPERAQADRDRILTYFADRGYSRASVTWQASPSSPAHQIDLEYRIEPGPQERIERIVIMGQDHTHTGIIRRELVLREGEPLRQIDLLASQRRLYDLGIFNQVQIAKQDTQSPETGQTVLVNVEEARRWTVGYGGGIEVQRLGSNQPQGELKASPRLSLDLTRLNVGGRAQAFSIHGRLSNLESGGGLSYLVPHFFARRDVSLRLNGLVDRSRDVLTFNADRREGSVSVEKRFSPTTLIVARYAFRRVQALDISTRISPEQIPLFSRPARVGALEASYVTDRRDDPADATEGSYSLVDASVAWHGFGSQANFLRFSGQNSTYRRLGPHLIFARSTHLGVESPFGSPNAVILPGSSPGVVFTHEIPLPERFFMGGSESHRGFSINQAGPRDPLTGFPLGGNALFLNSLELRVPLAEKHVGFAFFEDAGNVFSTGRKMRLLKFTQNSPTDFDYTVHAAGAGVRYKTRFAPVRFDVGYDLNPPRFQVQVPQGLEVRRLSRFQFFLSIGQSF